MSRGDTQFDLDVDTVEDPVGEQSADDDAGRQFRDRLQAGAGRIISMRALVLALLAMLVGAVLIGGALPLGLIGNLVGIVIAAFIYGTVSGTRRYFELGLTGGVVAGGLALLGNFALSLLGPGVPLVVVGFVAGALAGVLGHYFGRDLRDGLTRDI